LKLSNGKIDEQIWETRTGERNEKYLKKKRDPWSDSNGYCLYQYTHK